MKRKNLETQIGEYLSAGQMESLVRCTSLLQPAIRNKLYLWLLFERRFRTLPIIADRMESFIYQIVKHEIDA